MANSNKPSQSGEKRNSTAKLSHTRRKFLVGAGSAVTATALAGCGGGGGGGEADEISVAFVSGEGELFQDLVDQYVEDDTDISVNVELFPYANLFEKVQSVLSTQGDAYDIGSGRSVVPAVRPGSRTDPGVGTRGLARRPDHR
jgi:multiple sugar transport system substrate-binding protein